MVVLWLLSHRTQESDSPTETWSSTSSDADDNPATECNRAAIRALVCV